MTFEQQITEIQSKTNEAVAELESRPEGHEKVCNRHGRMVTLLDRQVLAHKVIARGLDEIKALVELGRSERQGIEDRIARLESKNTFVAYLFERLVAPIATGVIIGLIVFFLAR